MPIKLLCVRVADVTPEVNVSWRLAFLAGEFLSRQLESIHHFQGTVASKRSVAERNVTVSFALLGQPALNQMPLYSQLRVVTERLCPPFAPLHRDAILAECVRHSSRGLRNPSCTCCHMKAESVHKAVDTRLNTDRNSRRLGTTRKRMLADNSTSSFWGRTRSPRRDRMKTAQPQNLRLRASMQDRRLRRTNCD